MAQPRTGPHNIDLCAPAKSFAMLTQSYVQFHGNHRNSANFRQKIRRHDVMHGMSSHGAGWWSAAAAAGVLRRPVCSSVRLLVCVIRWRHAVIIVSRRRRRRCRLGRPPQPVRLFVALHSCSQLQSVAIIIHAPDALFLDIYRRRQPLEASSRPSSRSILLIWTAGVSTVPGELNRGYGPTILRLLIGSSQATQRSRAV